MDEVEGNGGGRAGREREMIWKGDERGAKEDNAGNKVGSDERTRTSLRLHCRGGTA